MIEELSRAHRLLCSRFVQEEMFRALIGGPRSDINAVIAYLRRPVDSRAPVSLFLDPLYYAAQHALPAEEDRLLHFLDRGLPALLSPHPLIDLRWIASHAPSLLGDPPGIDGLMDVLDQDLADPSPYFDRDFYTSQFGGPRGTVPPKGGLLRHFLTQGVQDGLQPNAWVDIAWYQAQHSDVPAHPYAALWHFIILGDAEGRSPGPDFDSQLYLRRYADVAQSGLPPLLHYLAHGRKEGRQASAERAVSVASPVAGESAAPSLRIGQGLAVDAETLVAADRDIRARIAAARQARKDAVRVKAPRLHLHRATRRKIRFEVPPAPRISVLIPVFNEAALTRACLASLAAADLSAGVEIVLADDASTDPAIAELCRIPGLRVVRHAQNLGFLASCNAAFGACRGDYVLLLNNDTEMAPDAIARLAAALDADPGLGAVGPKLIYPDGRLQEAGCAVLPDGTSVMTGLFGDPSEPGFMRDRDVAYCSGAALMVRRSLVGDTLFDPAFSPAYCEDVDLCLRLADQGHRVGFVHKAVVVHHLSASSSPAREAVRLQTIARNQQLLAARWGERLQAMDETRVLAFFLPQFHPTPENDLWWGKGFTEWTNVARAQPSYEGHYQPHLPADLGFYDLRLAETLAAQAALARRYGVSGFVFYHYNFGQRRVLHRPLRVLRDNPDIDLRFCLCWANENWTRHWDGGSREILLEQSYDDATIEAVLADATTHAADPRAILVEGCPLFLVYRVRNLPDPRLFAARARDAFRKAGFAGVHLVYVESMELSGTGSSPSELGFDAAVEFPPHGLAVPASDSPALLKQGWSGYRYDYPDTVCRFVTRDSAGYPRYPTVFPGWDNTPRQPLLGSSFDRATPEAFRVYVEEKLSEIRDFHLKDRRLLFVNAWNEWAEGAHLEPDSGFGHRWLEALRDALQARLPG